MAVKITVDRPNAVISIDGGAGALAKIDLLAKEISITDGAKSILLKLDDLPAAAAAQFRALDWPTDIEVAAGVVRLVTVKRTVLCSDDGAAGTSTGVSTQTSAPQAC